MSYPVFPYTPSMGLQHTLHREFLSNQFVDGFVAHGTAETAYERADGAKGVSSYRGVNIFTLSFKNLSGKSGGSAQLLWDFLMERLENGNEPFYFYNPTECFPPDLTGAETRGRYLVRIQDPSKGLSRSLDSACKLEMSVKFVEHRELLGSGGGSGDFDPDIWPGYYVTHYTQFLLSQYALLPALNGPYIDQNCKTPLDVNDFDGAPTFWFIINASNRGLGGPATVKLVDYDNPSTVYAELIVDDSGAPQTLTWAPVNIYDEAIKQYMVQFVPPPGPVNYGVLMPQGVPTTETYNKCTGVTVFHSKIAVFQTNPSKSVVEVEVWGKNWSATPVNYYLNNAGTWVYGEYIWWGSVFNEWCNTDLNQWYQHYYELGAGSGVFWKYEAAAYQHIKDITLEVCVLHSWSVQADLEGDIALIKYEAFSPGAPSDVELFNGTIVQDSITPFKAQTVLVPESYGTRYAGRAWGSTTFTADALEDGAIYTTAVRQRTPTNGALWVERVRMRIRLENLEAMRVHVPLSQMLEPEYSNNTTHRYRHPGIVPARVYLESTAVSFDPEIPFTNQYLVDGGTDPVNVITYDGDGDQAPVGPMVPGSQLIIQYSGWTYGEEYDILLDPKNFVVPLTELTQGHHYMIYNKYHWDTDAEFYGIIFLVLDF